MLLLHSSPRWAPPLAGLCSEPPHWSAFPSPRPSLRRRPGLQGSLRDPVDSYRLLLAAAPRWLLFKAGAAAPPGVGSSWHGAEGLWQEGVSSQLPSTGKQHMWMSSSPGESFWRPLGRGQVRVQGEELAVYGIWDVPVTKAKIDLQSPPPAFSRSLPSASARCPEFPGSEHRFGGGQCSLGCF